MTQLTRRSVLQLSIAGVTMASSSPARAASSLEHLWSQRSQLIAERKTTEAALRAAETQLPFWCRPGPKYIENGGETGPVVGWPRASDDEAILLADGRCLVRVGFNDLRDLYDQESAITLNDAKINFIRRSRQLRERLRARRHELTKVGRPSQTALTALDQHIERIEQKIFLLPPDADVIAARLLIAYENHSLDSATEIGSVRESMRWITHAYLDVQKDAGRQLGFLIDKYENI